MAQDDHEMGLQNHHWNGEGGCGVDVTSFLRWQQGSSKDVLGQQVSGNMEGKYVVHGYDREPTATKW